MRRIKIFYNYCYCLDKLLDTKCLSFFCLLGFYKLTIWLFFGKIFKIIVNNTWSVIYVFKIAAVRCRKLGEITEKWDYLIL